MTATGPREATHGVRAIFFDAVGTLLFPDPPAAVVYSAIGREFGLDASPVEISHRFRAAFRDIKGRVELGVKASWRDGVVFAVFGPQPDLVGWAATVSGHPRVDLLKRLRPL